MIHINLLPIEIRKDAQKKIFSSGSGIPLEIIVGSIGGVFFILVFLHIVLLSADIKRAASYGALEQQWKTLESQRNLVDGITKELRELKNEEMEIQKLFSETFHTWSETLNRFSAELPKGVWFNKMAVDEDGFVLQGSAIARDVDEIVLVHSFENKLRSDLLLKIKFKDFSLEAVQRRKIQSVSVADFLIKAKINSVSEEQRLAKSIVKDRAPEEGKLLFDDPLPGVPEDARANSRVTDQKSGTQ